MNAKQNAAEKSLHNQENILTGKKLYVVYSSLSLVLFFSFIDQNGISVALPTIAKDLNATGTISWAGTSSLIANTVFSVQYGRLSDIFGRKVVFLTSCALLALADLLCGFAQTPAMLYFFRAVAGLAGGGVTSLAMIIVSDVVTLEDRGKYQGIIGMWIGLGNVAGPFMSAGFSQYVTWRAFFWTLTPVVAIGGLVANFLLPNTRPTDTWRNSAKKIDYWGSLTSSVAIIFILIPISGGGVYFDWDSPMVISLLTVGGLAIFAFVLVEWRYARLPMLPLSIFLHPTINVILIQSFLLGWSYQSLLYYLPQYYQNVRGYSAIKSAALTVPMVVFQSTFSISSGQYISRLKRYGECLWLGFFLWTLGSGLTAGIFTRTTHPIICIVCLCIIGSGVGNTFQPTIIAVQAHAPKSQRAVIISNRNFFRCLGGAVGLAISAAVLQLSLKSHLPVGYKYLASEVYSFPDVGGAAEDAVLDAYMTASRNVFIMNTAVIGLCLIGCIFVKDKGLQRPEDAKAEKEAKETKEASEKQEVEGAAGGDGVMSHPGSSANQSVTEVEASRRASESEGTDNANVDNILDKEKAKETF